MAIRNKKGAPGRAVLSERAILRRVRELGREISTHYSKRPPIVLGLMNGAVFFLVDLLRELPPIYEVRCASVASYNGTESSGKIRGLKHLGKEFHGRDVLVVDDIFDTGRTLAAVRQRLLEQGARRVDICVFLKKKKHPHRLVRVRWVGFEIEDEFVIGYGLDYDGLYRGLKSVHVLDGF